MSKLYLTKIFAFVLMLILLAGFVFFRKDENSPELSEAELERQRIIENIKEQERNKELSEEEKKKNLVKALAENFTTTYYSYKINDFSNIYLLKDEMTSRFWSERSKWLEENNERIENEPKRYVHFNAYVKSSEIISLDENEANISVRYMHEEVKGGMAQGETTIKYVDEFGKEFGEENPLPLVKKTEKIVLVKLMKEDDKWKLDNIGQNER